VSVKAHEGIPIRPLAELVRIYEDAALWSRPAGAERVPVVAIALNTSGLAAPDAERAVARAAAETGLEAADPVREGDAGADRLARALREAVPA
jgi:uncharacterized NAD-dependent epimerase/dehydratase family protein